MHTTALVKFRVLSCGARLVRVCCEGGASQSSALVHANPFRSYPNLTELGLGGIQLFELNDSRRKRSKERVRPTARRHCRRMLPGSYNSAPPPRTSFARPSTAITGGLRSSSPLKASAIPQFTSTLRDWNREIRTRGSGSLVAESEPQFPHDKDSATRPFSSGQHGYSFGSGRPFGATRTDHTIPPDMRELVGGASFSDSFGSSGSFGSTKRSDSRPPSVTLPVHRARVSNYGNPIGSSRWTGQGMPGNRSYYPLPFGRHTFAPRTPVPSVAARPW